MTIFDTVYCASAYCEYGMDTLPPVTPGMTEKDIFHQLRGLSNIPIRDVLRDADGNYWCKEEACKRRHDLMNWGKAHNWPEIICPPYAVAYGQDAWHVAIRLGTDEYMQALAEAIAAMEDA